MSDFLLSEFLDRYLCLLVVSEVSVLHFLSSHRPCSILRSRIWVSTVFCKSSTCKLTLQLDLCRLGFPGEDCSGAFVLVVLADSTQFGDLALNSQVMQE